MTLKSITDVIWRVIHDVVEDLLLPTGHTLLPACLLSLFIAVVSFISCQAGWVFFIDWRGALLAFVLYAGVCVIERNGNNEISTVYRAIKSAPENTKEFAKNIDYNKLCENMFGDSDEDDGSSADTEHSDSLQ